jgi:hypothetical protein
MTCVTEHINVLQICPPGKHTPDYNKALHFIYPSIQSSSQPQFVPLNTRSKLPINLKLKQKVIKNNAAI